MISGGLEGLDDLPGRSGVAPHRVGVTGKAQMNELPGDAFPVKLAFYLIHDVGAGLNAGAELLTIPAKHTGGKAVIAAVRASGIDVDGVVAVLSGPALWYVDRLHFFTPSISGLS